MEWKVCKWRHTQKTHSIISRRGWQEIQFRQREWRLGGNGKAGTSRQAGRQLSYTPHASKHSGREQPLQKHDVKQASTFQNHFRRQSSYLELVKGEVGDGHGVAAAVLHIRDVREQRFLQQTVELAVVG